MNPRLRLHTIFQCWHSIKWYLALRFDWKEAQGFLQRASSCLIPIVALPHDLMHCAHKLIPVSHHAQSCESIAVLSEVQAFLPLCLDGDVTISVTASLDFVCLVFFFFFFTPPWPKQAEMKAPLPLAKGCCLGTGPLHAFVTYRLTFMAQHALVDFLGQDQVARLRSGPLERYNSPCVCRAQPGGRTTQMRFVLS